MHQAQEGNYVLDLAPPVKAQRADQAVGQPGAQEGFFQQARLGIGAVHDGKIAAARLAAVNPLANGIHHKGGFSVFVHRLVQHNAFAMPALGEQVLGRAVKVAVDHCAGGVQHGLGRAVILFEQNFPAFGVVLLEAQHIAVVCAAPAVD